MLFRDLASNGKLRLTGKDRVRFLNGLFTNDVAKLAPGEGCHAAMLTIKGKVLADALLSCEVDALWIDLEAQLTEKVKIALEKHLIVDDVVIEDQSASLDEICVSGADARSALATVLGVLPELPLHGHLRVGQTRVMAVQDLGLPGFRLIGGARSIAEQLAGGAIPWLSASDEELLRIEAGQPRYGVDMGEDHLPIESRLDDAVSHTKGCYMGQEVIARVTSRGQINRKLCGVKLAGDSPALAGSKLSTPEKENAGTVTSSVVSPRHGAIALAYVHRSAWEPGSSLTLHEGEATRAATVVALPFS